MHHPPAPTASAVLRHFFVGLRPLSLPRSPVLRSLLAASVLAACIGLWGLMRDHATPFPWIAAILCWIPVLFANAALSLAESKGRQRMKELRFPRHDVLAARRRGDTVERVPASALRLGDVIIVEEGDLVPGDGQIIRGTGLVNESAITGESAPVIRQSEGGRSAVIGGTRVMSGSMDIRITANSGETFLEQMATMMDDDDREWSPTERRLRRWFLALAAVDAAFVAVLWFAGRAAGVPIGLPVAVALFAALLPTAVCALAPAITIAGISRLLARNILAFSPRAVEAAGRVNIVLLDKTGTVTVGERHAVRFLPAPGVRAYDLIEASLYSSLSDETVEGRSIVHLAKRELNVRGTDLVEAGKARAIPFSYESPVSGVDIGKRRIRKGSWNAVVRFVEEQGGLVPPKVKDTADGIARDGGTPLLVAENDRVLGVIHLHDTVREGVRPRLAQLRAMGIRSIMITGDHVLTAASIAAETGMDDFVAEATPADKLAVIDGYQKQGYLVAMIGDGANDSPALAQADVAVAMHTAAPFARAAANIIDLDSSPAKLLDVVEAGKEILITRRALVLFSLGSGLMKYAVLGGLLLLADASWSSSSAGVGGIALALLGFDALSMLVLLPVVLGGLRYRLGALPPSRLLGALRDIGAFLLGFLGAGLASYFLFLANL